MKSIIKIFGLAIVIFVFSSCEKLVEIDLPNGKPLAVIESQLTNEIIPWEVQVSNSQAYYKQDSVGGITDAKVTITDNHGSITTLIHIKNGLYRSATAMQCKIDSSYTLKVEALGNTYTATETCHPQYKIDLLSFYFIDESLGYLFDGWYAFIKAEEWEPDGDYYEWKFYVNDTISDDYILEEDEFKDGGYFNITIDPKDPLSGFPEFIPRPFEIELEEGDSIRIEQYRISQKYYNYLIQQQVQLNNTGTPFDSPPVNPISNISNNALGFFSIATKEVIEGVVK